MNRNDFAKKLQRALTKEFGEGYEIILQEVEKNNGVNFQGVTIHSAERNISPTIYLDPFWEAYEEGVTLAELTNRIKRIYRREMPKSDLDMSFFQEFGKVKERICFRLIHAASNRALLEKIPHIGFLDLAICFFCAYSDDFLGDGSILIRNSHLAMWHTTAEELYELARVNTPALLPVQSIPMETLLGELFGETVRDNGIPCPDFFPMQIVSNNRRTDGAACMLYPGLLEKTAEELGGNFFILPSSVHEIIFLPDSAQIGAGQLKEMILEVNGTQVRGEEKLSDSLYYFDAKEGAIRVL